MRARAAVSVTAPLRGIRLSSPARTALPRQHTQRTLCTSCRRIRTQSGLGRPQQPSVARAAASHAPGVRRYASAAASQHLSPLAEYDRRVAAGTLRNDEHQRGEQAGFLLLELRPKADSSPQESSRASRPSTTSSPSTRRPRSSTRRSSPSSPKSPSSAPSSAAAAAAASRARPSSPPSRATSRAGSTSSATSAAARRC